MEVGERKDPPQPQAGLIVFGPPDVAIGTVLLNRQAVGLPRTECPVCPCRLPMPSAHAVCPCLLPMSLNGCLLPLKLLIFPGCNLSAPNALTDPGLLSGLAPGERPGPCCCHRSKNENPDQHNENSLLHFSFPPHYYFLYPFHDEFDFHLLSFVSVLSYLQQGVCQSV